MVGLAEIIVGVGLLILVAYSFGEVERSGVLSAGIARLTAGEQDRAEAVERVRLAGPVP